MTAQKIEEGTELPLSVICSPLMGSAWEKADEAEGTGGGGLNHKEGAALRLSVNCSRLMGIEVNEAEAAEGRRGDGAELRASASLLLAFSVIGFIVPSSFFALL